MAPELMQGAFTKAADIFRFASNFCLSARKVVWKRCKKVDDITVFFFEGNPHVTRELMCKDIS